MTDEIRQDGKVVLSSEDGFSIPMFFNNLCGKNFSGEKYRDYIKYIALGEMGFKPGRIEFYRDGVLQRTGEIPSFLWYNTHGFVRGLATLCSPTV